MSEPSALHETPDLTDREVPSWVDRQVERASRLVLSERAVATCIEGSDFTHCEGPFGRHGDRTWRAFALAILAADWACYAAPADRVDFVRLLFVLDRFPQGFRLWLMQDEWGFVPVGYTAWYPIERPVFRRIASGDPPLVDRALVPLRAASPGVDLYLFNYSVAPGLKSRRTPSGERAGPASPVSSSMMQLFARDIGAMMPAGLAAITVSGDGSRIAERFGMKATGELEVAGEVEITYATPQLATVHPTQK